MSGRVPGTWLQGDGQRKPAYRGKTPPRPTMDRPTPTPPDEQTRDDVNLPEPVRRRISSGVFED